MFAPNSQLIAMFFDVHTHNETTSTSNSVRSFTLQEALSLNLSQCQQWISVGIHPWHMHAGQAFDMDVLEQICSHQQVIFIGECGLDKHSECELDIQTTVFKRHITISETLKKPLIIHCVGLFNELLTIKNEFKPSQPWIIHGFRGKPQLAQQLLKAGCFLSFGEKFNEESVKVTPIEKLLIETDESQLPVQEIYHRIGRLKAVDPTELNASQKLIIEKNC